MSKTVRFESVAKEKAADLPIIPGTGWEQLAALKEKGIKCYPERPLSYSSLKNGASKYLEYIQKPESPGNPAMEFGTNFEALLLEYPDIHLYQKWTVGERMTAELMKSKAMNECSFAPKWIQDRAIYKNTHTAQFKTIKIVANPDVLVLDDDLPYIVDIKTINDVSNARARLCDKQYCYALQAAIYTKVYRLKNFYFWFIEKKEPFNIEVIWLSESQIQYLHEQLGKILEQFKYCLEHGFHSDLPYVKFDPSFL